MSRIVFLLALCVVASDAVADDSVTFNLNIRPILSDKCFFCHGPDNAKREADLRLDVREVAVSKGAINLDNVSESEMLKRITTDDPDLQMPPPSAKLGKLTEQDAATLKKWIEQGAEYEGHWSFISLDQQAVKIESSPQETARKIDELVRKGLADRGLKLQPSADRSTLIRRLSFDLTGLPPRVEDVESFVADQSAEATEKLIERLLSTPQYGERMTVDWLDTARYADSYGFQGDRER